MQTFLCSLIHHHISSISWCVAPFSCNCKPQYPLPAFLLLYTSPTRNPQGSVRFVWCAEPYPFSGASWELRQLEFVFFKRQFSRIDLRFTGQRERKHPTNTVINLTAVVERNAICVPREGLCFMIQQRLDASRLFELVPNSIETNNTGKQSRLILQLTKCLL